MALEYIKNSKNQNLNRFIIQQQIEVSTEHAWRITLYILYEKKPQHHCKSNNASLTTALGGVRTVPNIIHLYLHVYVL